MKLRKAEREKLKQLVADAMLCRLRTDETIHFIESSIKVKLSPRYIQKVKKWLKEDMQRNFTELRQDKYAYIHEFLQRIEEIKDLQRNSRALYGRAKDDYIRAKCISELHSLTLSLVNLYDLLPAITERSFYNASPSPLYPQMDSGAGETESSSPMVGTATDSGSNT